MTSYLEPHQTDFFGPSPTASGNTTGIEISTHASAIATYCGTGCGVGAGGGAQMPFSRLPDRS